MFESGFCEDVDIQRMWGDDVPNRRSSQQVVAVIISPDSTEFSVGEQMQFSAFVLTDAADTIAAGDLDVEWEGEWWSSDPEVFNVENKTQRDKTPERHTAL